MAETTVGQVVVLSSEWRAFLGGPLTDLDANPSITITPLAGGAAVLGPTTTGVQHIATGLYSYAWPAVVLPAEYVVEWNGLADGDAVVAVEGLTVLATAGVSGPCSWDIDDDYITGVCPAWAGYTTAVRVAALQLATFWLWGATGRRFGPCPVVVRPAQPRGGPEVYRDYVVTPGAQGMNIPGGPFLFAGRWFNAGCASACCGAGACAVVLRGPVHSVTEVLVDGEVVPPSSYRVDVATGAYLLVRTDGGCWPACQNFSRETTEVGTFEVSYSIGEQLPSALELAAAMLACEYGKHLTGGACALPAKMTRLSRQGVEIEVEPPSPDEGRTGIREVDDVVATLNPSGLKSPPRVFSLDLPEQCDRYTVIPEGS